MANKIKFTLSHEYTADDLRSIWNSCRQDFETFLEMLSWLETLSESERAVQLRAIALSTEGE